MTYLTTGTLARSLTATTALITLTACVTTSTPQPGAYVAVNANASQLPASGASFFSHGVTFDAASNSPVRTLKTENADITLTPNANGTDTDMVMSTTAGNTITATSTTSTKNSGTVVTTWQQSNGHGIEHDPDEYPFTNTYLNGDLVVAGGEINDENHGMIVGVLTDDSLIPTTGTANYSGEAWVSTWVDGSGALDDVTGSANVNLTFAGSGASGSATIDAAATNFDTLTMTIAPTSTAGQLTFTDLTLTSGGTVVDAEGNSGTIGARQIYLEGDLSFFGTDTAGTAPGAIAGSFAAQYSADGSVIGSAQNAVLGIFAAD